MGLVRMMFDKTGSGKSSKLQLYLSAVIFISTSRSYLRNSIPRLRPCFHDLAIRGQLWVYCTTKLELVFRDGGRPIGNTPISIRRPDSKTIRLSRHKFSETGKSTKRMWIMYLWNASRISNMTAVKLEIHLSQLKTQYNRKLYAYSIVSWAAVQLD